MRVAFETALGLVHCWYEFITQLYQGTVVVVVAISGRHRAAE